MRNNIRLNYNLNPPVTAEYKNCILSTTIDISHDAIEIVNIY